jgi:hypothetical protein
MSGTFFLMRFWLSAFVALFLPLVGAPAQDSFPGTAPVTFRFRESLKDRVVREPDTPVSDESYIIGSERVLVITGTAPLAGFDLSEIDDFSPYSIVIGDFDTGQISGLQGRLSDDENFFADSSRNVVIPILALNYDGDEVTVGTISLNWNNTQVEFTVQIDNVNQILTEIDSRVATDFYRERDEAIDAEDLTAAFAFGPFSYNLRTVYTIGTASSSTDPRVAEVLSDVSLFGSIDSVPPTLTITSPAPATSTALGMATIVGTVQDKRQIQTQGTTVATYDGEVALVEVQVGTAQAPGSFVQADLNGSNWALPNVPLAPGENRITVRATDVHGNVTTSPTRKITYLLKGTINVEAEAVGFLAGATGPAGTVKGAFLSNSAKSITARINEPFVANAAKNIEAGQQFTVTAVPAPGAVFNGWTAILDGAPHFTALTEKLTFETKPNLFLRAEFVPNPFDPVFGVYHGLVAGNTAAERGTFQVTIGKTGAFTGKLTAGALTLPIRGKVIGSGRWEGVVKKGAVEYAVEFTMNVSGAGNRTLSGTLSGGGLSADITADLKDWRKPRGSIPGNLATDYAAAYNVVLTPPTPPISSVPRGTGFGRVTISAMGAVRFVGKLGDNTPVSAGATLVKRLTGEVLFPFFVPLDKKQGNIIGTVAYSLQPSTDLTATLDWSEPTTTKVEPQAFNGGVNLAGSRYTPPAAGGFAMLGGAGGDGSIELTLPAYTEPALPAGQGSQPNASATLDPLTHTVTLAPSPSTDALAFKMKIAPKTGLFSGSFKDPQLLRGIPFTGVVVQKANGGLGMAGGVFARGNRAGAIDFGPPPPP